MTWYGRSLTLIIIYSITGLSHPSYDKQKKGKTKGKNKGGLDIRNIMTQFGSSLTPIIF